VSIAAAVTAVIVLTEAPERSPSAVGAPTSAPPPVPSTTTSTTTTTALSAVWPLTSALDPVWADTPGGCLRVTAGERVLYDAGSGAAAVPASVTKVLTAATALRVLGADRRLHTTVLAASAPVDGVVGGDLWLVGGGDPVLGTDAWASQLDPGERLHTSLDQLADRVVAAGVRRVQGRLVGDESRFDADRYVDTWPARLISDGEAGPLSALSVNDGFATWGHPGVPFGAPPADAATLFAELLEARGVTIGAGTGAGTAPAGIAELASIDSAPLGELVRAMLRHSDNGTAELLVKELGRQRLGDGSTAAGTRVITDTLTGANVPLDGVTVADGSGLSDAARLTCRSLTTLLARDADMLSDRLAVAGRDGTLARRFVGTPAAGRVRAKTGSLDGVAALAGYIDTAAGTVEFAYLINELPIGQSGRTLQDRLAVALATASP